ncbi:formate dehydrogenase accessory sulfurtransferase FdhD [Miniphocaeibacter massiliensis]|uniref:formate dehydrogenase accessory sulfurtransferase FdhD n=1 Tax=Miniphocaeibacter massiliensis TaxID=2041841 RepID=UPI000C1C796E|nr:formate dehydrogenase accessory sulfurtransferase FdhD [Miniphocaeibacter massiliensis]
MNKNYLNYDVKTYKNGEILDSEELVVEEKAYAIFLNDEEFTSIVCSPFNLEEMAVGFLWSEGILRDKNRLKDIYVLENENKILIDIEGFNKELETRYFMKSFNSCCGRARTSFYYANDAILCKKNESNISVLDSQITKQIGLLEQKAELFEKTGGVHCAALIEDGKVICFMEDIGRHNTLDKIAGYCFLNNISMENKIIVFTGRLSSEIVLKICKMEIPIIISRSAPTNLGIEIAKDMGITLCGFARNERYHIYSNSYRIKASS